MASSDGTSSQSAGMSGKRPGMSRAAGCVATKLHHRSNVPWPESLRSFRWRLAWILAIGALLACGVRWPCRAADPQPLIPGQIQQPLGIEDWRAVLHNLAPDLLTNAIVRLVAVRALFETGRLPEEQFAWFDRPGPELLSTGNLEGYAGAAHLAETLLQLGCLNAAERLAFDSIEMEGENPSALRTLARLHVVRGLTNAALVFLNRLEAYPEQQAWAPRFRAALAADALATTDPSIPRIRANLLKGDQVAAGLTTERLLRLALESNPTNRMAFQFLVAHQLFERRLLQAIRALATSPQPLDDPLPRHYAEAVLLHRHVYPGISLEALVRRVPPAVVSDFQRFLEMLKRGAASPEQLRSEARREFGKTYWHYYLLPPPESASRPPALDNPKPHE